MDLLSGVIYSLASVLIAWQIIKYIVRLEIEKYCVHGKCICNEDIYMENETINIDDKKIYYAR
jgi:hypothetical protein